MCGSDRTGQCVPEKPSNKAPSIIAEDDHGAAEMVEERGLTKGNLLKFKQVAVYTATEA